MIALADLRTELVQGLSKALVQTAGDRLDSAAAVEAAQSVVQGHGLPDRVASIFGGRPVCRLVSFDADHIQGWVFGSERVQVAKGASSVLDAINRRVRERDPKVPGITGVAYSAGGGGMLFAVGAERGEDVENAVRSWLEKESHELTFTVISMPIFARDLLPSSAPRILPPAGPAALDRFSIVDGLRGALVRLQVQVREAKDSRPRFGSPLPQLSGPLGAAIPRCPSCGRRPPSLDPLIDDGPDSWCEWCQGLRRACFDLNRENLFARDGRPLTFSDFAEASSRRRKYLAFLAIDGNGMGGVVQGVRDLVQLRAFSEATTRIYEAARNRIDEILARGFLKKDWTPEEAHLSLLSGGDEITLVLPAAVAPLAAVEILQAIEAGFDEQCRPGGLLAEAFSGDRDLLERLRGAGAAAGVVSAQAQYPVRLLRRYADDLQKQAKRACGPRGQRSAIAWTLLTDSSPLPEGLSQGARLEELGLDAFATVSREAEAAAKDGLPASALWNVLAQCRREEQELQVLGEQERTRVVALVGANFFRYQIARNDRLKAWWSHIRPETANEDSACDAVDAWFQQEGTARLQRLLELLALEAFPGGVE